MDGLLAVTFTMSVSPGHVVLYSFLNVNNCADEEPEATHQMNL